MRPISSSSSSSEIENWCSPIPYLFGGLSLLMLLISVALMILICSKRKHFPQLSSAEAEDITQAIPQNINTDSEPKILVIMAGDDKPTYLGKPITSSTHCTCAVNQVNQLNC
ncbi:hypothetical protein VNO78_33700 [Psophocarpus tetragonolobus]|uniref:Uncharacterized protein n=1 Tax=Psophocarpus tetragonolobus TaxID=3891 RepID=A0AAN9RPW2_PSOTE